MEEVWKPLSVADGYPTLLEVSNFGRARRGTLHYTRVVNRQAFVYTKPPRVFRPYMEMNGYFSLSIYVQGRRVRSLVHRLVATAFLPRPDGADFVNHKDGNKRNNRSDNLEWVTLSENNRHAWRTGLVNLHGENHPSHKLTCSAVANIKRQLAEGARVKEIAIRHNVSTSLIYKIRSGIKRCADV